MSHQTKALDRQSRRSTLSSIPMILSGTIVVPVSSTHVGSRLHSAHGLKATGNSIPGYQPWTCTSQVESHHARIASYRATWTGSWTMSSTQGDFSLTSGSIEHIDVCGTDPLVKIHWSVSIDSRSTGRCIFPQLQLRNPGFLGIMMSYKRDGKG